MPSRLHDSTWREKLPPICPQCGYNLTGIESGRCPECGRGIVWSELRINARTVYHALRQAEDVNDLINVGVYTGVAAIVIVLLFFALDWAVGLSRVVAFLFAIATLGCGLQVFRLRRFPEWTQDYLTQRPNYLKAAALLLVAIAAIALVIFLP